VKLHHRFHGLERPPKKRIVDRLPILRYLTPPCSVTRLLSAVKQSCAGEKITSRIHPPHPRAHLSARSRSRRPISLCYSWACVQSARKSGHQSLMHRGVHSFTCLLQRHDPLCHDGIARLCHFAPSRTRNLRPWWPPWLPIRLRAHSLRCSDNPFQDTLWLRHIP
jgi:hypothetical protein